MRSITLVAICDEYDVKPGLIIKGTPTFEGISADRDGVIIAHDLLEHVNGLKHMGPVWDELEALGAIWQVRGRHGDLMTGQRSSRTPQENIASDVARMFDGWDGVNVGSLHTKAHDHDEAFLEILEIARRDIRWSATSEAIEEYLSMALHRMRTGFRKAQKKYGIGYDGASLFEAVREAVAYAGRQVEYEGQEFTLRYGNGQAQCYERGAFDLS